MARAPPRLPPGRAGRQPSLRDPSRRGGRRGLQARHGAAVGTLARLPAPFHCKTTLENYEQDKERRIFF